jgi:hypothetical protein
MNQPLKKFQEQALKIYQDFFDPGPDCASGIFSFSGNFTNRNDHIAFHLNHKTGALAATSCRHIF